MRAYKVAAGPGRPPRFAGSVADSKVRRDELMQHYGLKKAQVTTEEVEVPTDKAGLLEFLNVELTELTETTLPLPDPLAH